MYVSVIYNLEDKYHLKDYQILAMKGLYPLRFFSKTKQKLYIKHVKLYSLTREILFYFAKSY